MEVVEDWLSFYDIFGYKNVNESRHIFPILLCLWIVLLH